MINSQEDFFIKIYTSHFIARVRKGCSRFAYERELETEHNWNILTPKLWPSALCLSRSPGLLNRSPGVHSAGCWLSLLHLVQLCLQLYSPVLNCPLLFNSSALYYLQTPMRWYGHASAISSDIWRSGCVTSAIFGMACVIVIERKLLSCSSEVTLFRCVSLWGYNGIFFTSSHFISQFPPTRFPLITAIRMCHFFPVHHLEWHFWPGQKVKT